jgi:hypothetical protein
MSETTTLEHLLANREFEAASDLLRHELTAAVVLNPRDTALWYAYADRVSDVMRSCGGISAPEPFWRAMLETFLHSIEPRFGRVHKGHIYWRLAWSVCERSLPEFLHFLELARAEDAETHRLSGKSSEDAEAATADEGAHITLALVERMQQFGLSQDGVAGFLVHIIIPAYNAAVNRGATEYSLVEAAIRNVLAPSDAHHALALYREVTAASEKRLIFATVASTGALAEAVLLGVLRDVHGVTTLSTRSKATENVELGILLAEVAHRQLFPNPDVKAAFELVRLFRNRIHPGNERRQRYRLTAYVSDIVRVTLEFALLQWASFR